MLRLGKLKASWVCEYCAEIITSFTQPCSCGCGPPIVDDVKDETVQTERDRD